MGTAACETLADNGSLEKEKNISSVSSSIQTVLSHQAVPVPPAPAAATKHPLSPVNQALSAGDLARHC